MSGLKFNKMSYKIQAERKLKSNDGSAFVLRKLVYLENMLVLNDSQFRYFYKQFTTHDLIGGTPEDIECMKLSIVRDMLQDLYSSIDERGFYHEEQNENQPVFCEK